MKRARLLLILGLIWSTAAGLSRIGAETPLALHPDNPHYFLFRGAPTLLITSGEHYGAVLNRDFDYVKYLDTLQKDTLNLTRVFSGAYVEHFEAFSIAGNTLAPRPGRFLAPWARSATPGYANGGNKFDLSRWNAEYFSRLKDFVAQAAARGIVVEVVLFCPFYGEEQWALSPMNPRNNVNDLGEIERLDVYSLDKSGPLLLIQEELVRKIVRELNGFDNVYYEICNEPYIRDVPLQWERHIADLIVETEAKLRFRHLISRNIANAGPKNIERGEGRVVDPHPAVSILNFHYASPPEVVAMNYHLERVIGENETGFHGTEDEYYRREAWEFVLAGGGLFNHLDYSFSAGYEDGTFVYPGTQPGGGSTALRRQLKILKDFIHGFEFVKMKPDKSVIRSGIPEGGRGVALAEPGRQYAVYVRGGESALLELELALSPGEYTAEWVDPLSGSTHQEGAVAVTGKSVILALPFYRGEIALRIMH